MTRLLCDDDEARATVGSVVGSRSSDKRNEDPEAFESVLLKDSGISSIENSRKGMYLLRRSCRSCICSKGERTLSEVDEAAADAEPEAEDDDAPAAAAAPDDDPMGGAEEMGREVSMSCVCLLATVVVELGPLLVEASIVSGPRTGLESALRLLNKEGCP